MARRVIERRDILLEPEVDPLADIYRLAERNRTGRNGESEPKTLRDELRESVVPLLVLSLFLVALGAAVGKDKGWLRWAPPEGEPHSGLAAMSSPPAESRNGGQPGARRESASKGDPATGASIGSSSAPPVAGAFVPPTLDTLRRIVDLAESGSFYLILDPAAGTLTLNLRGVVVRTWYPSHIEIGTPRVLFFERGDGTPADLAGSLWTGGRLDPPRTEERTRLEVDSQGTPQGPEPEAEGIPPTPEEAVPAPWRYAIRFEGGLVVEVVSNQASEAKDGLATAGGDGAMGARVRSRLSAVGSAISQRWTESGAAARTGGSLRHRLRIVLPPGDSGGLYRGIPLTADLVIAAHQAARSLP